MDDELLNLEAELKRLRPRPPSAELVARIGQDLSARPHQSPLGRVPWLWWAAVPLAASLAVAVLSLSSRPQSRSMPMADTSAEAPSEVVDAPLKPVAAENVLVSASDEGLVTLADGTPARRERLHYVETITWQNPRTKASLRWTVPREEVRVVPVSFQ